MNALETWNLISEADYLKSELTSSVKHEYVGGVIHAMTGASNQHNMIASNVLASLHGKLRGKVCRAYNSDTKIRVRSLSPTRYYYPDVSVICRSNPPQDAFQEEPIVVVEVLSNSTRRIDLWEKKEAYLSIPSLQLYLLVEQNSPAIIAFRRTSDGFTREMFADLETSVPLPADMPPLTLAEVYEAVEFIPEPTEDGEAN